MGRKDVSLTANSRFEIAALAVPEGEGPPAGVWELLAIRELPALILRKNVLQERKRRGY